MLINKPFATVLLAAAAAAAAVPAGADASRFNPQAHFSVTASGSIDETWSFTHADCAQQASGSEHVDFATPRPAKVIVALYDGVKGSVPVTGTLARSGSTCWDADASRCGTKPFRSRLANFSNLRSNWGFDLGVRDFGGCPGPLGADPLAGTTTVQALHHGPKWEWQDLLSTRRRGDRPKKVQTVTYKDHRVVPVKGGGSGQRVIDVTWKVTFKRLEAIH